MNELPNKADLPVAQDASEYIRGVVRDVVNAQLHAGANLSTIEIQIAVGRETERQIELCQKRDMAIIQHACRFGVQLELFPEAA